MNSGAYANYAKACKLCKLRRSFVCHQRVVVGHWLTGPQRRSTNGTTGVPDVSSPVKNFTSAVKFMLASELVARRLRISSAADAEPSAWLLTE